MVSLSVRPRGRLLALVLWWPACALLARGTAPAAEPVHETIDRLVEASLVAPPAPPAGDAEFLRRVSIDLTNRIASVADARAFLQDASPNKRGVLIDKLLASPEHARRLANFLDVTLLERRGDKYVGRAEWEAWLDQACLENRPWDQIVRELLTADGVDPSKRAAAKFSLEREGDPNLLTRDTGRIFFGRDIQCAQCHNHPNVKDYEQREYYGLLSFFQRTELHKQGNGVYVLAEKSDGDSTFESVFAKGTSYAARPALPGGAEQLDPEPGSRRERLAKSIAAGNNRAFNRNIVNRLWAMMMGRGLVHPVDFDHSDNPPTHPELLDRLADEFAAMKYDIRAFLKELALSKTYQRSFDLPPGFDRDGSVGHLPELEAAVVAAKIAADAAVAEFKNVRKEVLAVRAEIDKPLKELRAKEADVAKLRKAVAPAAAALAATQGQLKAKTDAHAAAVKALELAKQALAAIPADADLKAVVEKLQAKTTQFGTEIPALTKTAATQAEAVKQANEKVQAAEKVVAEAVEKVQQADEKAKPTLAKYAAAGRAQEQAKAASAACERRVETAKALARFRSKADALAQLEHEFGPIDREATAVRRARDEANARKDAKQREIAALERQCDGLRKAVAASAETIKQRQQASEALTAGAEQVEKAAALFRDEELTRAAGSVRKRLSALTDATAAARKLLSDQEVEVQAILAKCDRLRSEAPNLDRAAVAAGTRVAELEAKHHAPLAELAEARTQHSSARQSLLERLAESYAVAPLKPLSPEQIHWSTLQATGILSSYEAAAEAELNKKQPLTDAQKGDAKVLADRLIAREKDVHAKLAGNLSPFVSLYGGGPGQPQFEFFATADQALFMENGDAIRNWTAPGVTLIQRLTKLKEPAAFAEEL
ncbi:MAG TPA: DUF1549 domain-containing protein, partial [Gemmataceae bacterium]|nr:DUF1549 domain-containing protein [Gemmataceae bacterium]